MRKYLYLLPLLVLIPAIYVYATDGVSGVEHPAKVNSVVIPDKVCGVSGLAAGDGGCVLGYDTIGGTAKSFKITIYINLWTAPCSGDLGTAKIYKDNDGVQSSACIGVYLDDGDNAPDSGDTKVAFSSKAVDESGSGWIDVTFSTGSVTEGSKYWMGIFVDEQATNLWNGKYNVTAVIQYYTDDSNDMYDGQPNEITDGAAVTWSSGSSREVSVYVNVS